MDPSTQALLRLAPSDLESLMRSGHPIAPERLAGYWYRGVGLAMPRLVARFAQKFVKVFHQDPGSPVVRGWNIRMRQDGLDAPLTSPMTPATLAGHRIVYGHYHVVSDPAAPAGDAYPGSLVLDYSRGERRWSPLAPIRDYVVALAPDDPSALLGRMYLAFGSRCVPTPSYFLLVRHLPLDRVETPPGNLVL